MLKIGHISLTPTEVPGSQDNPDFGTRAEALWTGLQECFLKNPSILEVEGDNSRRSSIGRMTRNQERRIWFLEFLKLRVALSKARREELAKSTISSDPEHFVILFNGAIFIAYGDVAHCPAFTSLGQIARDFLREALSTCSAVSLRKWVSPTPLQPDIYLIQAEVIDQDVSALTEPFSIWDDHHLYIVYTTTDFDHLIRQIASECVVLIEAFYLAREVAVEISNTLYEIEEQNQELSETLAGYFSHGILKRLASGTAGEIRLLVSKMHMTLQEASKLELRLQDYIEQTRRLYERATLLKPATGYLDERVGEHWRIDRDMQVRLMEFAVTETVNFSVIQATVWASVIGAAVGALVTLIVTGISLVGS